jgi:hypothetical protein
MAYDPVGLAAIMKLMIDSGLEPAHYLAPVARGSKTRFNSDTYSLPQDRKISARITAPAESAETKAKYDRTYVRDTIKRELAIGLATEILRGDGYDMVSECLVRNMEDVHTASAFVFTAVQLRNFIREIEDDVKESLSK